MIDLAWFVFQTALRIKYNSFPATILYTHLLIHPYLIVQLKSVSKTYQFLKYFLIKILVTLLYL